MTKQANSEFLDQLQAKIPIREGSEGFRRILLEIYRAGTISLHNLSYNTGLPIPVASKIVNFLIEKEIFARIPEGILYTEKGMQFIEVELGFYGYGIPYCEKCEGERFPLQNLTRWGSLLDKLEEICSGRPEVNTTIDQAFATPATSLKRIMYAYQQGDIEGKNVAFLGDDDFTSIALCLFDLGFLGNETSNHPFAKSISVFDIDPRLLEQIRKISQDYKIQIATSEWDYRNPIPKEYLNSFNTIFLDPPYSLEGLKLTLSRAVGLLEKQMGQTIYLSYAHLGPNEMFQLMEIISEIKLVVMEIIPKFNLYEGAAIIANSTQMIRIQTTNKSQPLIQATEKFSEKIYTGELNPTLRIYACTKCSKTILVGAHGQQFSTIEDLKSQGCPYCENNTFTLEGKSEDFQEEEFEEE